ncbi:hypothetical protein [Sporosarcina jiandibaonis]|uniref:hypothetical protein n=1 Tax=Sporosarcina jiandibaonis TaxID=2715535 RepID=UPI001556B0BB|nr:hypothetical protein [Sporosarcina jiandibaonis]
MKLNNLFMTRPLVPKCCKKLKSIDYYDWLDRLIDAFEEHDIFDLVPKKSN